MGGVGERDAPHEEKRGERKKKKKQESNEGNSPTRHPATRPLTSAAYKSVSLHSSFLSLVLIYRPLPLPLAANTKGRMQAQGQNIRKWAKKKLE